LLGQRRSEARDSHSTWYSESSTMILYKQQNFVCKMISFAGIHLPRSSPDSSNLYNFSAASCVCPYHTHYQPYPHRGPCSSWLRCYCCWSLRSLSCGYIAVSLSVCICGFVCGCVYAVGKRSHVLILGPFDGFSVLFSHSLDSCICAVGHLTEPGHFVAAKPSLTL